MRKGFGSNKLSNVLKAYPELNRDWLLYGEGPMLKIDIGSYTPSESKSETVTVSREAWDIIKRQAESLERKDAQISDLISILKKINAQQDAPATCADAN